MGNKLTLIRGNDEPLKFVVEDDDKNPIDITGFTLKFAIKRGYEDDDECIYFLQADPGDLSDPTQGIHSEIIGHDVTGLWVPGSYIYQARIIDGDDYVTDSDEGICEIVRSRFDNEVTP